MIVDRYGGFTMKAYELKLSISIKIIHCFFFNKLNIVLIRSISSVESGRCLSDMGLGDEF
jgi:hypothetical protein